MIGAKRKQSDVQPAATGEERDTPRKRRTKVQKKDKAPLERLKLKPITGYTNLKDLLEPESKARDTGHQDLNALLYQARTYTQLMDLSQRTMACQTGHQDMNALLCQAYNPFFQFVEHLPEKSEARQAVTRVQSDVRKIQMLLDKITAGAEQFRHAIAGHSDDWYLNGNLLEMDPSVLDQTLRSHPIKDAQRFFDYFTTMLLRHVSAYNEYDQRIHFLTLNAFHLVGALSRVPGAFAHTFDAYIFLVSKVFQYHHDRCRIPKHLPHGPFHLAYTSIAQLIKYYDRASGLERTNIKGQYLDFAAAARTLKPTQWFGFYSDQSVDEPNYWLSELQSMVADYMRRRAHRQIRAKVFSMLGRVFSTDLTELLFEAAIQTEGIVPECSEEVMEVFTDYAERLPGYGPRERIALTDNRINGLAMAIIVCEKWPLRW